MNATGPGNSYSSHVRGYRRLPDEPALTGSKHPREEVSASLDNAQWEAQCNELRALIGDDVETLRIDLVQSLERTSHQLRHDLLSTIKGFQRVQRKLVIGLIALMVLQALLAASLLLSGSTTPVKASPEADPQTSSDGYVDLALGLIQTDGSAHHDRLTG